MRNFTDRRQTERRTTDDKRSENSSSSLSEEEVEEEEIKFCSNFSLYLPYRHGLLYDISALLLYACFLHVYIYVHKWSHPLKWFVLHYYHWGCLVWLGEVHNFQERVRTSVEEICSCLTGTTEFPLSLNGYLTTKKMADWWVFFFYQISGFLASLSDRDELLIG